MLKTLKTLYSFHFKYKGWLFLSFFFITLIAFTSSVYPYFYQWFIDNVTKGNYAQLPYISAAFLLVVFVDNILDFFIFFSYDKFVIRSLRDATLKIFRHVQNLDFAFHSEKSTGALISAFKRGSGSFWNISDVINDIYRISLQFIVLFVSYWIVQPKYALVSVLLLIINAIAMRILIPLNINKRVAYVEEDDKVSGIITENWLNYDTVKFFAQENKEFSNLKKQFKAWFKHLWGFSLTFRLLDVINTVINFTGYGIILALLLTDLKNGTITLGQFILVLGFLGQFLSQMRSLFYRLRNVAKNYADIQKYFDLLKEEEKVKDPEQPKRLKKVEGKITFNHVSFSYKAGEKVLRDIDFEIKPGESVAFVGRSGSGKTTITKLLLRFYDPQKGIISIDNVDIRDITKQNLRSLMGVVPQEPILFNNTISYNVGYGHPRATLKEIRRACKLANLDRFIDSLQDGYNTIVGERGIKLSGGQKQRLAIARMILSDPQIIIFDEATSHLDSHSEKMIQDAFWKVAMNRSTIIIAHRLSTIQKADRIIVLDKGRIIETGTHSELIRKKDGHYLKLWRLQTEGLIDY
ncbi:ABC transporter ATP-binding protein [candidate division WWE3 bacterium]|uniref:ABC transporter ATP-binding protein n=1 Tax=candidate division WWE3 bacterium TaxID=2053526 RepID=A0A955RQT2_UNCKA|nr:ABC transporter ATP-binding protein [candidate division WWE3 bacterium]